MPSALIHAPDVQFENFWAAMTAWLDDIYHTMPGSHRILLDREYGIELMLDELCESDRDLHRALTPSEEVVAHRLGLRIDDTEARMHAAWTRPEVRRSSLAALRGIHERYLGSIAPSRENLVVFEVTQSLRNADFRGYVEAHRLEQPSRWARHPHGSMNNVRAVQGPLWVHDLYANLAGTGLRGESLRARYRDGREREDFRILVGKPAPKPRAEVLETALRLWTPDETGAPYEELHAAVEAAALL